MPSARTQHTYDHRLIRLVQQTGDTTIATRIGVPRSTVAGWLRRPGPDVVTTTVLNESADELRVRVARLERRVRRLAAMLRVVFALVRILQPDLTRLRIPAGAEKHRLLRAIERSRRVLGLQRVLRAIGLSPSRLNAWQRAAKGCELDDQSSCPGSSPQGLTTDEVAKIGELVKSPDYRHVPTGRLALLAQRIGTVYASASTWYRLVRERGWRRPRVRVHPARPRVGIRATKPDEIWHIDATIIRLLDGTHVYLHAVIDNFSRRILSWCLNRKFDAACSADLLIKAGAHLVAGERTPKLLVDGGVENYNESVDAVVESGLLERILAQTEISFSNSLIEAWWRVLKHQWLFLNNLDSVAKVRGLVDFYVSEHNGKIPHSAFKGQTPDEAYFGSGEQIPDQLAVTRARARQTRIEENRAIRCAVCD